MALNTPKFTTSRISLLLNENDEENDGMRRLMTRMNKPNLWNILFVFLLLWLPRGVALDRFATPDEAAWVSRSGRFYHAITHANFAQTFQHGHPGVTVMWAGMAGYLWRYRTFAWEADQTVLGLDKHVEPFLRAHGRQPMDLLEAGRTFMVIGNTTILAMTAVIIAYSLGWLPALIGLLLVDFDPFYLGLTRLLHLDGMMSSAMLLSLAAFLVYLYRGQKRLFLIVSATSAGVGWLTRSPAFFLLPFFTWLMFLEVLRDWLVQRKFSWGEIRRSARTLGWWFFISSLVFVLLFPAMWVDPLNTIAGIFGQAFSYAAEGHASEIFFNGRIILGDPGWLFYPTVYMWRTTPLVLMGLLLVFISFALRLAPFNHSQVRWWAAGVLSFALFFAVGMSFGAKKFDRYLLPSIGALDWLAGLGWFALARWVWDRKSGKLWRWASVAGVVAVLGLQAWLAFQNAPYYITYYNPLLGGPKRAQRVMMIGWGEGLDQAARYLNTLPQAERLRVMSYYPNGCFSYFFNGKTIDLIKTWNGMEDKELKKVHYIVLYIHQWQRQRPDPRMLAYFDSQQPVYVARINGLEYAKVYALHP